MARKYKQNRQHTNDPYDVYLRWWNDYKQQGYPMSPKMNKSDFAMQYQLVRADKDIKNKIRTLARRDIVVGKRTEKQMVKELMKDNGDKTFADYYDWNTGRLNFDNKSKKEIYWEIRRQKEEEGWVYDRNNPAEWEKYFFANSGKDFERKRLIDKMIEEIGYVDYEELSSQLSKYERKGLY